MKVSKEYHLLAYLNSRLFSRLSVPRSQHVVSALIIDKKGSIISIGDNSYNKTHPKQAFYNRRDPSHIYLHAEIDALVKCKSDPYIMFISRMGKDGRSRIARPCRGCYAAIKDSKLKRVYYTNNSGELILLDMNTPVDEYIDHRTGD